MSIFGPLPILVPYLIIKLGISLIIGAPMFLVQVLKWIFGLIKAAAA